MTPPTLRAAIVRWRLKLQGADTTRNSTCLLKKTFLIFLLVSASTLTVSSGALQAVTVLSRRHRKVSKEWVLRKSGVTEGRSWPGT